MKAKKSYANSLSFFTLMTLLLCLMAPAVGFSQDEESTEPKDPEAVDLETSDGIALSAQYYPGTKGKESVPVILLHSWDGKGEDLYSMAAALQRDFGYACIVPDLRGHGASDTYANGQEIDRDRMRAAQIGSTIEDLEACKNYLIQENNEGNLNIDMLSIIGEDYSTILGLVWTIRDWSYAPLGSLKQGQDVKCVVLIDPVRNFKGMNGVDAYKNDLFTGRAGAAFPIFIAAKRSKSREAKNIFEGMNRGRRRLSGDDKHIKSLKYEISKQEKIVRSKKNGDRNLDSLIGQFIEKEVFNKKHDFAWAERKSK